MYPRIKFQSKKEFDAYMWRATYGFTGRQFEAGLMNLHVRSEWHDALRSYMDVWEEESELDAQRIRWWNQYSCTVGVGPEWFLDYATKKGVVKRLREETKLHHDVYLREHIAPVHKKLEQTLNVLMWDLGIEDMFEVASVTNELLPDFLADLPAIRDEDSEIVWTISTFRSYSMVYVWMHRTTFTEGY